MVYAYVLKLKFILHIFYVLDCDLSLHLSNKSGGQEHISLTTNSFLMILHLSSNINST